MIYSKPDRNQSKLTVWQSSLSVHTKNVFHLYKTNHDAINIKVARIRNYNFRFEGFISSIFFYEILIFLASLMIFLHTSYTRVHSNARCIFLRTHILFCTCFYEFILAFKYCVVFKFSYEYYFYF